MPLFPRPSLQPPETISSRFYFTSDVFVNRAGHDIASLLAAFEDALFAAAAAAAKKPAGDGQKAAKGKGKRKERDGETELAPFKAFKKVYLERGWDKIHLGIIDPALRKDWFDTVVRLILEHAAPTRPVLKRVGAVFAAYAFWGTQPASLGERFNMRIDLDLHEHLMKLPSLAAATIDHLTDSVPVPDADAASRLESLGLVDPSAPTPAPLAPAGSVEIDPALLDPPQADDIPADPASATSSNASPELGPARSSSTSILPSHSVYQVVSNLVDESAFYLVPNGIALSHPSLPTTTLREEVAGPRKVGKNVKSETGPPVAGPADEATRGEDVLATGWELSRWASGAETAVEERGSGSWTEGDLSTARAVYLASKKALLAGGGGDLDAIDIDVRPAGEEDATEMEKKVVDAAAGMTVRAFEAGGVPIRSLGGSGTAADGDLAAFKLVHEGTGSGLREWAEAKDALVANVRPDAL